MLLFTAPLLSQQTAEDYRKHVKDSIRHVYLREAAIRNPLLRQATITTDIISRSRIKTDLYGSRLLEGNLAQVRTTALLNIPVHSWGKNSLSATGSFFYQNLDIDHVKGQQFVPPSFTRSSVDKATVGITLNFQRVDSLFGKAVIYTGSISGLTNDFSAVQKLSYFGGVIMAIKQTKVSRTMVGLLLNIDPSLNVPVIPTFTYWRMFKNGLELNVNLPQQINVRKQFSPKMWASFGTSIAGSVAFFRYAQPGIPQDVNFSSLDLKTGPQVEYRIGKLLVAGVQAGILTPVMSRQFERTKKSGDYFISNRINTTPFVSFSLSVLPVF